MPCFNRRKASIVCLWITALTTILSKNHFSLRLENTCFYIFQFAPCQLSSTSWISVVLKIHATSIAILTSTNWCTISSCQVSTAISTQLQLKTKKKYGFLKIYFVLYLPSMVLEWGVCVETTDVLHLQNYLARKTGCPVGTWQNEN